MASPAPSPLPRWLPLTAIALAAAGLGVAGYLTVEHYTAATTLACPETGVINCQKVTSSAQSTLFGVPIVLLGLLFFAVMLVASLPWAWRQSRPAVRLGRLAVSVLGVVFVVYLVGVELFALDAICLWCTVIHLITVALFGLVAFATALTPGTQRR